MNVFIDIETVPSADRDSYIQEARDNFKAPSSLTKGQAGEDLGLTGDALKYTSADDVKRQWEREMASVKADEVGDDAWRKTALDGTHGRVLCIGWKVPGIEVETMLAEPRHEADLLRAAFAGMQKSLEQVHESIKSRQPLFIGHNVTFDLKFLYRRCVILGVRPPFDFPFSGRNGRDYYCTMRSWCEYGERISQNRLLEALGIVETTDMDGSQVCDAWLGGELDRISAYCGEDVANVEKIYNRLTFNGAIQC